VTYRAIIGIWWVSGEKFLLVFIVVYEFSVLVTVVIIYLA